MKQEGICVDKNGSRLEFYLFIKSWEPFGKNGGQKSIISLICKCNIKINKQIKLLLKKNLGKLENVHNSTTPSVDG